MLTRARWSVDRCTLERDGHSLSEDCQFRGRPRRFGCEEGWIRNMGGEGGIKLTRLSAKIELDDGERKRRRRRYRGQREDRGERGNTWIYLVGARAMLKVKGRWRTMLELQFVVDLDGAVEVAVWEVGERSQMVSAKLSAP